MKKMQYKKPEFDFQEIQLMEKVADVCWGKSHYAYFDENGDGIPNGNEPLLAIEKGNSCNDAKLKLIEKLKQAGYIYDGTEVGTNPLIEGTVHFSDSDVHTNVGKGKLLPVYS